ncbi:hypothetical protein BT63DRAFT_478796 [Microthyrium microscopicum]|uniref:RING-type domain-containing protein n=1 Tax=Microthyrium microscopicum TaxID=703497 RepID=A0A6A6UES6_9PEZI|nr:hypothetical protein BT63DRAFT_478796 [Microthyrium microscopicum]
MTLIKDMGRDCPYQHPEPGPVTRVIDGALVQFASSGSVEDVSFASDYTSFHISKLPIDSTPDTIVELLQCLDLLVKKSHVRIFKDQDTMALHANITTKDRSLASLLKEINHIEGLRTLSDAALEVKEVTVYSVPGGQLRRIDSRKVQCSWQRPTREVILIFGQQQIADRVRQKFQDNVYTIRSVKVSVAEEPQEMLANHRELYTTLRLQNVPVEADQDVIKASIRHVGDQPDNITLLEPSYRNNFTKVVAALSEKFSALGNIRDAHPLMQLHAQRFQMRVTYCDEQHATVAARLLQGQMQEVLGGEPIEVNVLHSTKSKVCTEIFDVLTTRLAQLKSDLKDMGLDVNIYHYRNAGYLKRFTTLKIEGASIKAVAYTDEQLQKIMQGEIMCDQDGKALWCPSLEYESGTLRRIQDLQTPLGVKVIRKKYSKHLQIFGPLANCSEALLLVKTIVEDEYPENSRSAKIDADTELGEKPAENECQTQSCAVCWTEADTPITTSCGHVYCLDCLENMCKAGDSGTDFAITCQGASGNCDRPLQLPELQSLLQPSVLEDVLRISFLSYISKHSNDFHHCPIADCSGIYRVASKQLMRRCGICLEEHCAMCHHQHPDISCAQFRANNAEDKQFEELKTQMGLQDCPNCYMTIEKSDGCNHITCKCGAHICWACLKHFETSGECYGHLRKVHGGFGIAAGNHEAYHGDDEEEEDDDDWVFGLFDDDELAAM